MEPGQNAISMSLQRPFSSHETNMRFSTPRSLKVSHTEGIWAQHNEKNWKKKKNERKRKGGEKSPFKLMGKQKDSGDVDSRPM